MGVGGGVEMEVYGRVKRVLGVGKEESQQISKFADCPFS